MTEANGVVRMVPTLPLQNHPIRECEDWVAEVDMVVGTTETINTDGESNAG